MSRRLTLRATFNGPCDEGIAAMVTSYKVGTVEKRELKDAVFSFLVITEELAWSAAEDTGVDLGGCRAGIIDSPA